MDKKVQAKHVPERVIFARLAKAPGWLWTFPPTQWWANPDVDISRFFYASPELRPFPWKVLQAKLRALLNRGLIDGCDCGCRGDWELTSAGAEYVKTLNLTDDDLLPLVGWGESDDG